jgi:hypothetical protein
MISAEQVAHIRHLFHAEHWKVGTIAAELHLHPDTVRDALDTDRFRSHPRLRDRLTDPYLDFLRQTLQQYPRLRATRLFHMIRPRGYTGSLTQLRRVVAELRRPAATLFSVFRLSPANRPRPTGPTSAKLPSAAPAAVCPASSSPSPTAAPCGWNSSSTRASRIFSSAMSTLSRIGVERRAAWSMILFPGTKSYFCSVPRFVRIPMMVMGVSDA